MADFLDQTFITLIILTCPSVWLGRADPSLLYGNKKINPYKLFSLSSFRPARAGTEGGLKRSFINHSKNHF